jgi:predicted nuclease of predicted toxin-antitoxin system
MDKGFPPKIILLRTGNQSTKYIAGILSKHKNEIIDFLANEEYGVLEIY